MDHIFFLVGSVVYQCNDFAKEDECYVLLSPKAYNMSDEQDNGYVTQQWVNYVNEGFESFIDLDNEESNDNIDVYVPCGTVQGIAWIVKGSEEDDGEEGDSEE